MSALRISMPVLLTAVVAISSIGSAEDTEPKSLAATLKDDRGIWVVLGDDTSKLALQLATETQLTVYYQAENDDTLNSTRQQAERAGLLGNKLYVAKGDMSRIGLADNLADALVAIDAARALDNITRREMYRVVRPGGELLLGSLNNPAIIKPAPKGLGHWSHPYHGPDNNPQADDQLAKAPYLTRFLAKPYYGPMPEVTVSAGGRLFKAFGHISFKRREWSMLNELVCLSAFNGTQLWRRDLPKGYLIHRNTLIATPEVLYLADNDACRKIDAATGKVIDQIVLPKGEGGPGWKWMALDGKVLYALLGAKDPVDTTLRGTREHSGWPWSGLGRMYAQKEYPWGFGNTLVAIDPDTKAILWRYRDDAAIDSRALCMNSKRIFIYSHKKFLAAIDRSDGKQAWWTSDPKLLAAIGEHDRAQQPRRGYSSQVYVKCSEDALYFAGPQRKRLVAVSVKDGKVLWQHGDEGNYQLVLRDNSLYAMGRTTKSKKFDPLTGKVLAELDCLRGNCTRATGTVDSVFARGDQHGGTLRLVTASDSPGRIPAMRPACQDGVLAANGLLYWGPWMCDCNHSLVGIISLGPAGDFDFAQPAQRGERLEAFTKEPDRIAPFSVTANDWPTYRANNQRSANTPVAVADKYKLAWTIQPKQTIEPTAPVAAGGLVFVGGTDGVVRAIDAKSGAARWTNYTGGDIRYPPTVSDGRVFVGSSDGWVYTYEAATGRSLWRFRAAPIERRIPVYGRLISTWPVTSGVLVKDDVAYAAAGIVSHDGTHVYALDAMTGKVRWQNNTSGQLIDRDAVAGVSVQGHLLLDGDRLYMAGGNVVSPAIYSASNGRCLNQLTNEWQKAPRGSELFLYRGRVRVVDSMMYSPRGYIPSRYHAKYLLEASSGDVVIQGTQNAMARVKTPGKGGKPEVIWKHEQFRDTYAVALCSNSVVAVGQTPPKRDQPEPQTLLQLLDSKTGAHIWNYKLPHPAQSWGLCIDHDGRIVVTLIDGRVLCFEAAKL
jgi:outer membrane protein assembly factor BamB